MSVSKYKYEPEKCDGQPCVGDCDFCNIELIERKMDMDRAAMMIVEKYIQEHLDKSDDVPPWNVYTVWKAKILQNWKYLISSTLLDGMYYELTYNGDKNEWYLDAYKKFENRVIRTREVDEF